MLGNLADVTVKDFIRNRDKRGELTVLEQMPFEVVRFFYVHDVPAGTTRGQHGHFRCRQYLICQVGRLLVEMTDGTDTRRFELQPGQGVALEPGLFGTETYIEPGTVMLVLCDRAYDKGDYIHDLETLRHFRASYGRTSAK